MTLRDILDKIKSASMRLPNIHSFFEGNIYTLNQNMDVEYSSIVVTQQQHQVDMEEQLITYRFVVFFVDRQTDGGENAIDVQSHGIQVLNSIAEYIDNQGLTIGNYTIDTFRERFASLCAGAFMEIDITTSIDTCDNYETT